MAKKFDVVAIVGKYKDAAGVEKNRYVNMGAVIEGKRGDMLKIESIPVGWDGWAYLNEPKPRGEQRQTTQTQRKETESDEFDGDDIPF